MRTLGIAAVLLAAVAVPGFAAAPSNTIALGGRLQLEKCGAGRRMAVDSKLGLLIVIRSASPGMNGCAGNEPVGIHLEAYSTQTLGRLGSWQVQLPHLNTGGFNVGTTRPLILDTVHHRLFLVYSDGDHVDRVTVVDIGHLSAGTPSLPPLAAFPLPYHTDPAPPGFTDDPTGNVYTSAGCQAVQTAQQTGFGCLKGVNGAYDAASDTLTMMMAEDPAETDNEGSAHGPGGHSPSLVQLAASSGAIRWSLMLGKCSVALGFTNYGQYLVPLPDPVLFSRSDKAAQLTAGCLYSKSLTRGLYSGTTDPSQAALSAGSMMTYTIQLNRDGSLTTDASGAPVVQTHIGRSNVYSGLADPASGRLFYIAAPPLGEATSTNASGPTAVSFDVAHHVYMGAITIGTPSDLGGYFTMAAGGGRLYSIDTNGVIAADATATPEGQGVYFPIQLCKPPATAKLFAAASDERTHQVFVLPSECGKTDPTTSLLVYQDGVPSLAAAPEPDPDSYTRQIAEQPGVTQVQYGAHGEAVGARVRVIGGTTGLLKGASNGGYDFVFNNPFQSTGVPAPPDDFATREIELARIRAADVSNYQSNAEAVAAAIDATTAQQLKSSQAQFSWPFEPASCSDPGNGKDAKSYGPDTGSSTKCDFSKHSVTVESNSGPVGLTLTSIGRDGNAVPLLLSLARAHTSVSVTLDPAVGLISETHSVVDGIEVGGVSIGAVDATSRCRAHGHKKTASCTYTRTIAGVTVAGQPVGGGACVSAPPVNTCTQLLNVLNTLQPGILIFTMPEPDTRPGFFEGSAGGYQAVAQRELYEHLQDEALNYDASPQVPALQVFYNDDSTDAPSRLDLQLANVESESHYGISVAEPFNPPALTDLAPLTVATQASDGLANLARPAVQGPAPTLIQVIQQVVHRFVTGFGFALRNPGQALAIAVLVGMFGAPLLLALRRRKLESLAVSE